MRGKEASASAARRDRQAVDSELAAGRRQVVKLTTRVKELEALLAHEREARVSEGRKLRTQIAGLTSPEVEALRSRVTRLKNRVTYQQASLDAKKQSIGRIFTAIRDHYIEAHGLNPDAAAEAAFAISQFARGEAERKMRTRNATTPVPAPAILRAT